LLEKLFILVIVDGATYVPNAHVDNRNWQSITIFFYYK